MNSIKRLSGTLHLIILLVTCFLVACGGSSSGDGSSSDTTTLQLVGTWELESVGYVRANWTETLTLRADNTYTMTTDECTEMGTYTLLDGDLAFTPSTLDECVWCDTATNSGNMVDYFNVDETTLGIDYGWGDWDLWFDEAVYSRSL